MFIKAFGILILLNFVCTSFGFVASSKALHRTTSHITCLQMSSKEVMFQSTITLTSAAANVAIDAACQEASKNNWAVTIAIADAGGIPLLVKRNDGAFAASYEIAVGKARTAAQFQKETGLLEASANVSDGSSRTSLLSAPYVLMRGGVPIWTKNGICIGSVGVSGVAPDQDEQVAKAAVNALASTISKL